MAILYPNSCPQVHLVLELAEMKQKAGGGWEISQPGFAPACWSQFALSKSAPGELYLSKCMAAPGRVARATSPLFEAAARLRSLVSGGLTGERVHSKVRCRGLRFRCESTNPRRAVGVPCGFVDSQRSTNQHRQLSGRSFLCGVGEMFPILGGNSGIDGRRGDGDQGSAVAVDKREIVLLRGGC